MNEDRWMLRVQSVVSGLIATAVLTVILAGMSDIIVALLVAIVIIFVTAPITLLVAPPVIRKFEKFSPHSIVIAIFIAVIVAMTIGPLSIFVLQILLNSPVHVPQMNIFIEMAYMTIPYGVTYGFILGLLRGYGFFRKST
jgi:hypothetical protein